MLDNKKKAIIRVLYKATKDADPSVFEEDGGPGSGNWGHKGRQGKRGGSGKGGGKQYRGGRGDVAYHSSKKDWANGLTGEDGHKADQLVSKWAGNEPTDNPTETAEQNVMKNGKQRDRREWLELKGKARQWSDPEMRERFMDNLDDKERKVLDYLQNVAVSKYGGDENAMMDKLSFGERDYYLDLKAKALDGEGIGAELPPKLAKRAGIDQGENPEPKPEPKPEPQPEPEPINKNWIESLDPENKKQLDSILRDSRIDPYGFAGEKSPEEIEKEFTENGFKDVRKMYNYGRYLNMKIEAGGKPLNDLIKKNLTKDEHREYLSLVQHLSDQGNLTITDADIINTAKSTIAGTPFTDQYTAQRIMDLASRATGGPEIPTTASKPIKRAANKKEAADNFKSAGPAAREALEKATTTDEVKKALDQMGIFATVETSTLGEREHSVDLSSVSVSQAKATVRALDNLVQRYPGMIGEIAGIDGDENRGAAYASCSLWGGGTLHFGRIMRNSENIDDSYRSSLTSGFHPQGTVPPGGAEAVMMHEIGHAVDGYLTRALNKMRPTANGPTSFANDFRRKVMRSLKMTINSVGASNLSGYATKNAQEWFAEAFAEGMYSPNPRPIAKEFMRQLDATFRDNNL